MGRFSPAHWDDVFLAKVKSACIGALQQLNDEGEIDSSLSARESRLMGLLNQASSPRDVDTTDTTSGESDTDLAHRPPLRSNRALPLRSSSSRTTLFDDAGTGTGIGTDPGPSSGHVHIATPRPASPSLPPRRRRKPALTFEQLAEQLEPEDPDLHRLCKLLTRKLHRRASRRYSSERASSPSSATLAASDPSRRRSHQQRGRPSVYVGTSEYRSLGRSLQDPGGPSRSRYDLGLDPPVDLRAPMTITIGRDGITTREGVRSRTLSRSLNARVNAIDRSLQRSLAARAAARADNLESDSIASAESLSARRTRMAGQDRTTAGRMEGDADTITSPSSSDEGAGPSRPASRLAPRRGEAAAEQSLPQSMRDALARLGPGGGDDDDDDDDDDAAIGPEPEATGDGGVGDAQGEAPDSQGAAPNGPRVRRAFIRIGREVEVLRSFLQRRINERLAEVWAEIAEEPPAQQATAGDRASSTVPWLAATGSIDVAGQLGDFVGSREVDRLRSALLKTLEAFDTALGQVWVSRLMEEDADQQLWRRLPADQRAEASAPASSRATTADRRDDAQDDGDDNSAHSLLSRQRQRGHDMQSSFLRASLWRTRNRARELQQHADSTAGAFGAGLFETGAASTAEDDQGTEHAGYTAAADGLGRLSEEEVAHRFFLHCLDQLVPAERGELRDSWRWRLSCWYFVHRSRRDIPDPAPRSEGRPADPVASAFARMTWTPYDEDPYKFARNLGGEGAEPTARPSASDDLLGAWAYADARDDPGVGLQGVLHALEGDEAKHALELQRSARLRAAQDRASRMATNIADPRQPRGTLPSALEAASRRLSSDALLGSDQQHAAAPSSSDREEANPDVSLTRTTSLSRRNAIRPAGSAGSRSISSLVSRRPSSRSDQPRQVRERAGDLSETLTPAIDAGVDVAEPPRRQQGSGRSSLDRSRSRSFTFVTTPAAVLGGRSAVEGAGASRSADSEGYFGSRREGDARRPPTVLGRRRRRGTSPGSEEGDEADVIRSLGLDGSMGGSGASTPLEARRATFEAYARRRRSRFHEMLMEAAQSDDQRLLDDDDEGEGRGAQRNDANLDEMLNLLFERRGDQGEGEDEVASQPYSSDAETTLAYGAGRLERALRGRASR
ncbi:uncharacterized protein PFL1_05241 [Pseudozyma flocculosa PF-1]|uniref:Uncharacterized protein n=1 Tax=Pseudozyma flocculosa PF-1 TaxID=1277687 RepID=A0A061H4G7_9BASI|nr:uncharacterized protein PFL1_05241 [Pseudozyma flocculosa PF-1]EPQ27319.1 hypothetical protein PFL1_05241 [Pseudozyma flocculosa PF-1]